MDLIQRRRVMLAGKRNRLPPEYQEVEWLGSEGHEYFSTRFSPTAYTSVHIVTSFEYDSGCQIFGARTGNNESSRFFPISPVNNIKCRTTLGTSEEKNIQYDYASVLDVYFNILNENGESVCVINGDTICYLNRSLFVKGNNNEIIAFGTSGYSGNLWLSTAKIYLAEIMENGVHHRKFIPCYRKSDNKPGMFDLCRSICPRTNSPFYINEGTYDFTVGQDVN